MKKMISLNHSFHQRSLQRINLCLHMKVQLLQYQTQAHHQNHYHLQFPNLSHLQYLNQNRIQLQLMW